MKLTQEHCENPLPAVQPSPSVIFKRFTEISHDSVCANCGLRLGSSEASIKIPGTPGVFCSNLCCEQGLICDRQRCRACAVKLGDDRSAHYCDDGCRKSIAGEPWGSGKRFLRWLALERPKLYRKVFESATAERSTERCAECGVPLDGQRADSRFCSDTHKKRFSRKVKTQRKCRISRDTPIGKQGLTEAQNGDSMHTLTASGEEEETAIAASSVSVAECAR